MTPVIQLIARTETRSVPLATPTVAVVGLGYVGLPTGIALAVSGSRVLGIDLSPARLDRIRRLDVDLPDTEIRELDGMLAEGRLQVTTDAGVLAQADTVIICVPTPVDEHFVPDLSMLTAACDSVVRHAREGQMLVLTSTSYVGTTRDLLIEPLKDRRFVMGEDIFVAFSPERVDPANADFPITAVPRVIGGGTAACARTAAKVLSQIAPAVHMVSSPEAAEMTKLYENTFRAVNIAFAQQMADASRAAGLDPTEVVDAAASKPYGFMPFHAGIGVGGHCIPCDPHYLVWGMRKHHVSIPLVESAMSEIAARPQKIADEVLRMLAVGPGRARTARVLIVGATYKPDVEDIRESPAVDLMEHLHSSGVLVEYHDPLVRSVVVDDDLVLMSTVAPKAGDYDVIVVATMHTKADYSWLKGCDNVLDRSVGTRLGAE